MREPYIITIELDEDSTYFTSMTKAEASKMRQFLGLSGYKFSVETIKRSPGYHAHKDLMSVFTELVENAPR